VYLKKLFQFTGLTVEIDNNRIFGLDIMRAFAISIVIVTHSIYFLPPTIVSIINLVSLDGVSLFFVLSGFLIGGILIKTVEKEGTSIKVLIYFWIKRWLRTIPNYFLVFSVVYLLYLHAANNGTMPTLRKFYFFFQNFNTPPPGYFIEGWSLSVEEWFYLSVPLLIFLLMNFIKLNLKKSISTICLLIIIFSIFFRYYRYISTPEISRDFEMHFRMQVITRLDSLMYGVIGAYLSRFCKSKWVLYKIPLLIFGSMGLIVNKYCQLNLGGSMYYFVFYLATNGLFTLCLLPFFSEYKRGSGFFYNLITYISLISYSLYLTNLTLVQSFIIPFLDSIFFKNSSDLKSINFFLFFLVTFIVSTYLYNFVEKPIMGIRKYLK